MSPARNVALALLLSPAAGQNMTRMMLDSIARLVDGSKPGVPDEYFDKLVSCMGQSKDLIESHDAAWAGFKGYYETNGTGTDAWGSCTAEVCFTSRCCSMHCRGLFYRSLLLDVVVIFSDDN